MDTIVLDEYYYFRALIQLLLQNMLPATSI